MKWIVALLALLVACAPAQTMEKDAMMEKDSMMEKNETVMMEKESVEKSSMMDDSMEDKMMEPELLGGSVSKYYQWDKAMFDQSVAEGKTVFLEFYASWCPVCQQQHPELVAGFNELNDANVVGFRIPYKDDMTTDEHTALAKQYGIAYQHTHVVVKDGKIVLKNPKQWSKDDFLTEMRKLA